MNSLTFLGTGGGRFVMLTQRRATGGIWMGLDGVNIMLDPGPGALIQALKYRLDPGNLDAVLCSHNHLDHYGEVEVMIEAMTHGLFRKHGVLYIQEDAAKYVSEYHRGRITTSEVKAGSKFAVGGVRIEALSTFDHSDGLGFRFKTSDGDITYAGDTGFDLQIANQYRNSKLLILNTVFPSGHAAKTHLNTDSAAEIVSAARPEKAVITAFGVRMLAKDPVIQAEKISAISGVETVAAHDGMVLVL